jgi:hypothetical protein
MEHQTTFVGLQDIRDAASFPRYVCGCPAKPHMYAFVSCYGTIDILLISPTSSRVGGR